jgi:hypothetical protein
MCSLLSSFAVNGSSALSYSLRMSTIGAPARVVIAGHCRDLLIGFIS